MADRTSTITLAVRDAYSVNVQAFAKALQQADKVTQDMSGHMNLLKSATMGAKDFMMGMGIALPINPMMALGEAVKYTIDAATEAQNVFAQTEAGVKSTGGVAGYTALQLAALAHGFQDTTTYSDETILSAENLLITFDKIRGPILKDATQAILDLSTRMGGDLQGAAIQVGKALQDPAVGLTALRRVGVSFNTEQVKVIKNLFDTGHVAEAQKMILEELAHEFGGSATAAARTFSGQMAQTKNTIEDVGEEIGGFLLKQLGYLANDFGKVKDLLGAGDKVGQAFTGTVDKMRQSVIAGDMSLQDYNRAVFGIAGVMSQGNIQLQAAIAHTAELTQADYDAMVSQGEYNRAIKEGTAFLSSGYIPATSKAVTSTDALAGSQEAAKDAAKTLSDAFESRIKLEQQLTSEDQKFAVKQGDLISKAQDLKAQIDKLTRANGALTTSHKDAAISIDERAAAEARLAMVEEDLTNHQKKAKETDLEFQARMTALTVTADNLRAKLGSVTKIGRVDNSKEIAKIQTELDTVNASIAENQNAHDEATKHIVYDYATQQLAVGGFTPVEIAALQKISDQMGFTSDSSEAMALRIIGATNQLAIDQNPDVFANNMKRILGEVVTAFQDAAGNAINLQEKLDALHDKTVTIDVIYNEDRRTSGQNGGLLGGGGPPNPKPAPAPAPAPKPKKEPPKFASGGFAPLGTVGTVGETGKEAIQVTPYGTRITPIGDVRNQSNTTIIINTSQPMTAQNIALLRAQAGAF